MKIKDRYALQIVVIASICTYMLVFLFFFHFIFSHICFFFLKNIFDYVRDEYEEIV